MAPLPETTSDFKTRIRHEVLAARAAKGQRERMLDDEALVQRLQKWISDTVGDLTKPVIAAYVPAGDEPGASVSSSTGGKPGHGFVEALANAVPGARILLPVCPPGPPQPLHWGYYNGSFSKGRFGLLEPVPVEDSADPEELSVADAIILPAVAADPTTGMRLGRGAGYYDRSLVFARRDGDTDGARAAAIAVAVFDTELRTELAYDEHDIPADYVITPARISQI